MKRAIFYAILGAVAAVLNALAIAPPIIDTVTHGGPAWLAWFLFTPFLLFTIGIAAAAHAEHLHYNGREALAVPEWHVFDEELPAGLSDAERAMELRHRDPIDKHFGEIAQAMRGSPWPVNLAGKPAVIPPREGETDR